MNYTDMENNNQFMPFKRGNYVLMLIGILILIVGFVIMSLDTEPHGFGFLGITLGPIVVMAGFIFEIFAILYNPKKETQA
jgi:steroid 5-alpha reductase family enzyme